MATATFGRTDDCWRKYPIGIDPLAAIRSPAAAASVRRASPLGARGPFLRHCRRRRSEEKGDSSHASATTSLAGFVALCWAGGWISPEVGVVDYSTATSKERCGEPYSAAQDHTRSKALVTYREVLITMDLTAVFAKTPKGVIEIKTRSAALAPAMRRVLIMADGKRPLADLVPFVQPHDVETLASALCEQGMIALADGSAALAPVDAESDSQMPAQATANAEPTTAHRPAVLHLALPASFVERSGAGPPTLRDTIEGGWPLGRELSFVVAAAPRGAITADPLDTTERATDSSAAAPPSTRSTRSLSKSHESEHEDWADFNDFAPAAANVASARVRNATATDAVNGAVGGAVGGATDAAQVPASAAMGIATGVAPGIASAAVDGNANGVASGFTAATTRGVATQAANGGGVATSLDALLEESKRIAVRALYERLGPYGEAPAAKIQECRSLEALHEQVQQAVRRIADFRGEKAAREYLLMLAQP